MKVMLFICVIVEEIKFVKELEDIKVTDTKEGIVLVCEISKAGLKVDWYKGDKKLRRDDKYNYLVEDGTVHKLLIDKVSAEDAGQYRAVYQNLETSATLTVAGRFHTCQYSRYIFRIYNTKLMLLGKSYTHSSCSVFQYHQVLAPTSMRTDLY